MSQYTKPIIRVNKIKDKIKELYDEISTIQSNCIHPTYLVEFNYGGNTGNYDPHSDSYWVDYKCNNCGKTWRRYK